MYAYRKEAAVRVAAPPAAVFAHADDPARMAAHMEGGSWMMGGGGMRLTWDEDGGRRPGSVMRLSGRVWGMRLAVEEAITERTPPRHKAWETRGEPSLLVIGRYRMGFDVEGAGATSRLRVFIDYDLPRHGIARLAGHLLGHAYAGWCVRMMATDTARHFAHPGPPLPA